MEAVVGWMDAMRRGDLGAAAEWFHPDVVWRGIPGAGACANRDEVLEMLGDSLVACPEDPERPGEETGLRGADAVELIAGGDDIAVLGARVPGLTELGGTPVHGQLFSVFRTRDGRIAAVADYARRGDALAAAAIEPPAWR